MDLSTRIFEPFNAEIKGHQNNAPAPDGRAALRDISNLANQRAVHGKKTAATTYELLTDKKAEKKQLETTCLVNSSESLAGTHSCSRNERRSFTSTLSARSKALCEAVVVNIDADDCHDDLAVVEYVDDLYKFYKETEEDSKVHDYMHEQPDINEKMRSILVDWLIEVHRKFELMPETLYLTIYIIDRFLAFRIIARSELQLVGISSMLVACKYEEIWTPQVKDLVWVTDNAYTTAQVLAMEKSILAMLDWNITVPTPFVFLARYTKASASGDQVMENMAFYLAELGLMDYSVISTYKPSTIAASAVYAARCILGMKPLWTPTLQYYTGFYEAKLRDCAIFLAKLHSNAAESKMRAVRKKYSGSERACVALISPSETLM